MMVSELELPDFDYANPALRGETFHQALAELVEQSWLARSDLGYLVLGRDPAMEFLRDRRLTFPSVEILALQGVTEGPVYDRTVNGLMAKSGDEHGRLRRLVSPAFSPKATERLRPRLRTLVEGLWDDMADTGRCEFVTAFAQPLPSMVIAELLGMPGEAERLAAWSTALQEVFNFGGADTWAATEQAYLDVYGYVGELVEERRTAPGDDLISTFATHQDEGDHLSHDECVTLVCSVIAGGTDTTQAQLSQAMRLFVEHPLQWELLGDQPELAAKATAEVLRFEPITPFTARLVKDPFTYDDVVFPSETVAFVCAATANRDADVFADPHRFDITAERGNAQILTFGMGGHYCLGVNLARAEIAEALAYLAPRMRRPELDGEAVFGSTSGIYGMESLPIRFEVAPA